MNADDERFMQSIEDDFFVGDSLNDNPGSIWNEGRFRYEIINTYPDFECKKISNEDVIYFKVFRVFKKDEVVMNKAGRLGLVVRRTNDEYTDVSWKRSNVELGNSTHIDSTWSKSLNGVDEMTFHLVCDGPFESCKKDSMTCAKSVKLLDGTRMNFWMVIIERSKHQFTWKRLANLDAIDDSANMEFWWAYVHNGQWRLARPVVFETVKLLWESPILRQHNETTPLKQESVARMSCLARNELYYEFPEGRVKQPYIKEMFRQMYEKRGDLQEGAEKAIKIYVSNKK